MRLSALALFIVLPAAAYAAASPRDNCINVGSGCDKNGGTPCCGGATCELVEYFKNFHYVGLICHLLRFTFGTELNTGLPLIWPTEATELAPRGRAGGLWSWLCAVYSIPLGVVTVVLMLTPEQMVVALYVSSCPQYQ